MNRHEIASMIVGRWMRKGLIQGIDPQTVLSLAQEAIALLEENEEIEVDEEDLDL